MERRREEVEMFSVEVAGRDERGRKEVERGDEEGLRKEG